MAYNDPQKDQLIILFRKNGAIQPYRNDCCNLLYSLLLFVSGQREDQKEKNNIVPAFKSGTKASGQPGKTRS